MQGYIDGVYCAKKCQVVLRGASNAILFLDIFLRNITPIESRWRLGMGCNGQQFSLVELI